MFAQNKALTVTGWIITVLAGLAMTASGVMKFGSSPELVEGFAHIGWPVKLAVALGVTEIICAVLYLVPQTTVLGAILLTGYLGGAIATHVRIGEDFVVHIILGVLIWLGPFLREPRLRAILPWRFGNETKTITRG